ncbi:hypothetical protein D1872_299510 [compost metagenome]
MKNILLLGLIKLALVAISNIYKTIIRYGYYDSCLTGISTSQDFHNLTDLQAVLRFHAYHLRFQYSENLHAVRRYRDRMLKMSTK